MFLYGGLQAGKSTEVKRTDIYYISICIRPIRTLLHLTSPGDQFWMKVLYSRQSWLRAKLLLMGLESALLCRACARGLVLPEGPQNSMNPPHFKI